MLVIIKGKLLWILLIIGGLFIWMLSGTFTNTSNTPSPQTKKDISAPTIKVKTATFKPEIFTRTLTFSGQTAVKNRARIAAQTAGIVQKLYVDVGNTVKQGDTILTLDVAERPSQITSAVASVVAAKKLANSARTLAKDGYMSKTQLAEREATLAEETATLQRLKKDLSYTTITAPISGFVETRHTSVGDFIAVGTAVLDIIDRTELRLTLDVAQKDRETMKIGLPVSATLINGQKIEGIVEFIATDANTTTRTYPVHINIDGKKYPIPTGMSAEVTVPIAQEKAYKIPHQLIVLNDEGTMGVMRLEGTTALFTPVKILSDSTDFLWITMPENTPTPNGLTLITQGQAGLSSGTHVTPMQGTR